MRIWYISHYAVPGSVSPGWRCHYVAKALAAAGHEVTVWAARCHHVVAMPCGRLPQAESREEEGYEFKTVPAPFYKGNGLGRLLNMLAFSRGMAKTLKSALSAGQAPDLAVISSPHLFVWAALAKVAAPGVKMIFEERDIWPESMVELAGVSPHHPMVWYMKRIMRCVGRRADGIISVLPGTEPRFRSLGVPPGRWIWLPNGADPEIVAREATRPGPEPHLTALNASRAAGQLVVLYAGSMGPPNALESVLDLARISGEKKYKIFLMGDGVSRPAIEKRAREERMNFIEFLPQVNRAESWRVMAAAETGYFSVKPAKIYEYGLSFNKIFDYFSLSLPIMGVTVSPYDPITLSGGGWTVSPGQPQLLHEALNRAAALPLGEREVMGRRGLDYVIENHDWRKLGSQYADFCENIVNSA